MYAIGTLPLIRSLHDPSCWTQIWYADDAFTEGSLEGIHEWFSLLCSQGPAFGYFPESTKSLVVVGEQFKTKAKLFFMIWEFRLLLVIVILVGLLEICMIGTHLHVIKSTSG